jgi:hypothetical protein
MAKRDWNDIKRRLEGLAPAQEGPCPECGCNPADPKRDKHDAMFVYEAEDPSLGKVEEDYQPPQRGEEFVCSTCNTVTDAWLIDDEGCVWFLLRRRGPDPSPETREDRL